MISMTGDKELIAKIESLSKKDAGSAARKGTRAGAKIIQQATKSHIPTGETGMLARSIKVRALKGRKSIGTRATIQFQGGKAFYGSMVELGTKKQKAQHFMKNAAETNADKALQEVMRVMKDEIVRVATK